MSAELILCLDVGNSHIFGGVYDLYDIKLRFRYQTDRSVTSDQVGVFLRAVLRENDIEIHAVKHIAICSVVPQLDYSLRSACIKYFSLEPFMLQLGVKMGLKIKVQNPQEVGSDQIAGCIAAVHEFPQRDLIIADFGTATTVCAVSKNAEYLGVAILPGMRTAMEALSQNAAMLPTVEIIKPEKALGKQTAACIQSGLYYSQFGAVKILLTEIAQESFQTKPLVIATGGFSQLFTEEAFYDYHRPDLVLEGLMLAWRKNQS